MTTLYITRNGLPIDPSTILRNVEIVFSSGYGLQGAGGEPSSATFQLVNVNNSYDVAAGDMIQIIAELDDLSTIERFTGRVYSRRVDFENIDSTVITVSATGNLAQLERIRIRFTGSGTSENYYEELDEDRIATILSLAEIVAETYDWDEWVLDPGAGVTFPETIHYAGESYGELARTYAANALGLMVDRPQGSLAYYDKNHARNVDPVLELDASTVLAGISVENSSEGLANAVRVLYGIPDENLERLIVDVRNESSIMAYGVQSVDFDSQLLLADDALDLANEWIYRNSQPRDNIPALSFTDDLLPDSFQYIEVGNVVRVTGLPQPLANTIVAVITGYRETWDFDNHWQIDLELVDGRYWGRGIIWDDIPELETWDTLATFWTWDTITEYDTTGFTTDRWKDAPANFTFANLSATTTSWDDWSN